MKYLSYILAGVFMVATGVQTLYIHDTNVLLDAKDRRIAALESEVRRLSGNQGSYSDPRGDILNAMRIADQYVLDKARLDMKLKAIREGREWACCLPCSLPAPSAVINSYVRTHID